MKIVTFLLPSDLNRKLKNEPAKNKLWNTKSDILRALVELYFTDNSVRQLVEQRSKLRLIAELSD